MVTTGVLGGRWRATVTDGGGIEPWDGSPPLRWHVAADDRWHSPDEEAAVRQTRIDGTPVIETRVRIPGGDAVQRLWSVADHGGLTMIEVENQSSLPIAVAFTRGDLLSARPAAAPIEGISLPAGSIAFPIGHHATLTVALPHTTTPSASGHRPLPTVAPLDTVVRGWSTVAERAGRMVLPDVLLSERLTAVHCELALGGIVAPADDPVAALIALGRQARMGQSALDLQPTVAAAVERAAKRAPRTWDLDAALDGAASVLALAGDTRACRDLEVVRARLACDTELPVVAPDDPIRLLPWADRRLVQRRGDSVSLLPLDLPDDWYGLGFEVHRVPTIGADSVSFAIRWHGFHPAVLWDQHGAGHRLTSPFAPEWSSSADKGDQLWPAMA